MIALFCLPAFCENAPDEDLIEEKITDDTNLSSEKNKEDEDNINYFHLRNAAQTSPKKEHNISVQKAKSDFIKNKENFYNFKQKELWLLRDEEKNLDYKP